MLLEQLWHMLLSFCHTFVSLGDYATAAIDIAVIEATEILPDGGVVPGAAGGTPAWRNHQCVLDVLSNGPPI
jgi:acyl-CoA hydrolase